MSRHTIQTLTKSLALKKLDTFIKVVEIKKHLVSVLDTEYGLYHVLISAFSPSNPFPLHKQRRHAEKTKIAKLKYVGKTIKDHLIIDLFYGPDRGYKNKSFYLEAQASCGHIVIVTLSILLKHKKTTLCQSCTKIKHGERKKVNNVRLSRTSTYNHWVKVRRGLPEKFQDFIEFKKAAGEKPANKAELIIHPDGSLGWSDLSVTQDTELHKISSAIRQAFRYSNFYRNCLLEARVETENGTKYRCALCEKLTEYSNIQIDHIEPIAPLDGSPLDKTTLIDRIWTNKIQALDRSCHSLKSKKENAIRRQNKQKKKELR